MNNEIFIHPQALCESQQIGANTRIWAFAHVLPEAKIGQNCNICDHVFIENDVTIGNNVTIKSGVQLWDGIDLEDNTFIGPNATFTNDHFPRSKEYPEKFLRTKIGYGASIGANAVILPGIEIGQHAMIGAGSVVTTSIPAHAIVAGNPATIIGFNQAKEFNIAANLENENKVYETFVPGVKLYQRSAFTDKRGSLSAFEFGEEVPFLVKRAYTIYNVAAHKFRANHAHKESYQFIVCVKGQVTIVTDNSHVRQKMILNSPNLGLHLDPKIWNVLYDFSDDAVVMVFNPDYYDTEDYINEYVELIRLNKNTL